jgi:hypothetical protein
LTALGDMVAVSTPRSAAHNDGAEEGVWQTVRRVASYTQEDLNLWWSVDAGYLLIDEETKKEKKAAAVVVSVEEYNSTSRTLPSVPSRPCLLYLADLGLPSLSCSLESQTLRRCLVYPADPA